MKKSILILITILGVQACVKFIETDENLLNKQLVINSIITPDSLIKVNVFENVDINNIDNKAILDADITLFENEINVENLQLKLNITENSFYLETGEKQFDTTYYYSSIETKVKSGASYTLKIKHPDYKEATCTTTIPASIQIQNIDTSSTYTFNLPVDSTSEWSRLEESRLFNFGINFSDTKDFKNYYRLIILYNRGILNKDTTNGNNFNYVQVSNMIPTSYKTFDPAFSAEVESANSSILGSMDNEYNIFNDQLFDGENYQLNIYRTFGIQMGSSYENLLKEEPRFDLKTGEFFHFKIILQNITEETYFYLKSFSKQYYNRNIPFVEPVKVYSNVENGIGIFGSCSSSAYEVTFGEYPMEGIEYRKEN